MSNIPNESLFLKSSENSYLNTPSNLNKNFILAVNSETVDAYINLKEKIIIVSIRGTDPTSLNDIKSDLSLPFNKLNTTQRFKRDLKVLNIIIKKYSPNIYDYYLSGHSLGGAIIKELNRLYPFIKNSIVYNSAFQTKDIFNQQDDIKNMYVDKDQLYKKGGFKFKNKKVIKFKSKGFFDFLFNRITPFKKSLQAHKLSNFNEFYQGRGINNKYENIIKKIIKIKN